MSQLYVHSIVDRYLDLYHIALAILHDPTDAEDAVQEAMARTMAHRHLNDPWRYCCRVLNNYCVDLLRKKYSLVDSSRIEKRIEIEEKKNEVLIDYVHTLIKSLPKSDRELIEMHFVQGLTMQEVADAQGKTLSNVKRVFSRIYNRIRSDIPPKKLTSDDT